MDQTHFVIGLVKKLIIMIHLNKEDNACSTPQYYDRVTTAITKMKKIKNHKSRGAWRGRYRRAGKAILTANT